MAFVKYPTTAKKITRSVVGWVGSGINIQLRRMLCVLLLISLLEASTPAAPQTIVVIATEWHANLAFWLRTNDLPFTLYRRLIGWNPQRAQLQETQEERNARIARVRVQPGKRLVQVGEQLLLLAIAYDQNNVPVGGVNFHWRSDYPGQDQLILQQGAFVPSIPGEYTIVAEIGGLRDSITVKVAGREPLDKEAAERQPIIRRVSSNSTDQKLEQLSTTSAENTTTTFLDGDAYGWNSHNRDAAFSPLNERGETPGRSTIEANSNNFRINAPIVSLPGRGVDLDLGLVYNSRLWSKANNANHEIVFDADQDPIAPGWSLNLCRIVNMVDAGAFIVEANGMRHSFSGSVTIDPNTGERNFYGNTTDGSFIEYAVLTRGIGTGNVDTYGFAKFPNGLTFGFAGAASIGNTNHYMLYTGSIEDNNGNYLLLYCANGRYQSIVDSLGRVVTFHYNNNNLLTAITAAGLKDDSGNITNRTLVRLHYKQLSLNSTFEGLTPVVRNPTDPKWVLDAIYYPATKTGQWFGDADSYSSYGMIKRVSERKGMYYSDVPLTEMGTVQSGVATREMLYDYPSGPIANLTDAPAYHQMTETWEGSTTGEAETHYEVQQDTETRAVTITHPDLTKTIEYSYVRPGQYDDGLVYKVEIRAGNDVLQSNTTTWEVGYDGSARVKRRDFTEAGQTSFQTYGYGSPVNDFFNRLNEVKEYDFTGALLRRTAYTYSNYSYYIERRLYPGVASASSRPRLLYVVTSVEVYAGDGTRVSRTENNYDEYDPNYQQGAYHGDLVNTPSVSSHDGCFDPYFAPSWYWLGGYKYRGNLTSKISYTDAANLAGPLSTQLTYDITGNVRTVTKSGRQRAFTYELNTQYAYPTIQTVGSPDSNSVIRMTTSATYDFNTGLALSTTDANSRPKQASYYLDSWRPKQDVEPTAAKTLYEYDDVALSATATMIGADGTIADQSVTKANGRGQAIALEALNANGYRDTVETQYDDLGRRFKQTLPHVAGQTAAWSELSYDALGRTKRVVGPDGSASEIFYNEVARPSTATTTPGQTARFVDEWGRERWILTDALERAIEVVEPNPNGNGSVLAAGNMLTKYSYDTLGNLTQVDQGAQQRRFRYDSLGRLTQQKMAEVNATLDNTGRYVSNGQWSDVFTYDARSNLTLRVDARGVKTNFLFNGDPLDRLQSVTYDASNAGAGQTIHPAATVTYQYMTSGDLTRVLSVTANNVSTETFGYDTEGRVSSRTLVFAGRPSYPALTEYSYDSLDRLTDVSYPAQYGTGNNPRKIVHRDYDVASRSSGLKVNGVDYASQILYNAASQATSITVGTGANQVTETNDYDPITDLLSRQRVQRPGATMLDLSYEYLRAGTSSGRTGQLTRITNNRNDNRSRSYSYDALGRLKQAQGGPAGAPLWTHTYSYDPYGNRLGVAAYSAWNRGRPGSDDRQAGQTAKASEPQSAIGNGQLASTEGNSGSVVAESADSSTKLSLSDARNAQWESNGVAIGRDGYARVVPTSASQSKSHHASRATRANAPEPQSAPPAFTDDPLNDPQNPQKTVVKAVHITELRDAINALRARLGMFPYSWQQSIAPGNWIKADPILEMRTALDQALGPPLGGYSSGLGQGLVIQAIHIQELRDHFKAAWNSLSQIPRDGYESLSYDTASNRIMSAGFAYDAAGNQTSIVRADGSPQSYEYDAANRMVKVRGQGGVVIANYTYGVGNQRLMAQDGDDNSNQRTYYVWSNGDVIAEYSEDQTSPTSPRWTKNYIYLEDRLLATQEASGNGELVQYCHPDRLGTRIISRSDGTWFEQVTLPFGVALNSESTAATNTSRRFTSYDRSASTGLDYAVNRSYDPAQGRFTQVDRVGMEAVRLTSPQSLNLYAYCENDPINVSDPLGTWGFSISFGGFFGGGHDGHGGFWGGLLGGLFSFGLGVLGSFFGWGNSPFIGWPFLGLPPRPRAQGSLDPPRPAPIVLSVSSTFPQGGGSPGINLPTDENDLTMLAVLLGEASTPGEGGWGDDEYGPDARKHSSRTLLAEEVRDEMLFMIAVVNNRLNDTGAWKQYGFKSWKDVIERDPKQFAGYSNGQQILKNLSSNGQMDRARLAISAIIDFHQAPFSNDFYEWRGIKQNGKKSGKPIITRRDGAFRLANTDFLHRGGRQEQPSAKKRKR